MHFSDVVGQDEKETGAYSHDLWTALLLIRQVVSGVIFHSWGHAMLRIRDRLWSKLTTFFYNFGWSDYVDWLDGWIPRLSLAVPIVGYLILFNDSITKNLTFLELTSGHSALGLSGDARLKFFI